MYYAWLELNAVYIVYVFLVILYPQHCSQRYKGEGGNPIQKENKKSHGCRLIESLVGVHRQSLTFADFNKWASHVVKLEHDGNEISWKSRSTWYYFSRNAPLFEFKALL